MIKNFKDLKIWEKAHRLTLEIYQVTKEYPKEELYSLVSHMRRAAVSVTANIVEGKKRNSVIDFIHFLNMADTSLEELKYYFILSKDLGYLQEPKMEELNKLSDEIGLMLRSLEKSLSRYKK